MLYLWIKIKRAMDLSDFYRGEWRRAEKEGDVEYAKNCKEVYRGLIMLKIKKSYHFVHEKLKMYPMINLN